MSRLDAGKTILTSNSRTLALMTALQKEQVKEVEDAHGLTELYVVGKLDYILYLSTYSNLITFYMPFSYHNLY